MGNVESIWGGKRDSKRRQSGGTPAVPEISVTEASPAPADGAVFILPGLAETGCTGQAPQPTAEHADVVGGRRNSEGSPLGVRQLKPDDLEEDSRSLSGSEGNSSRQHFLQVMMESSPQVRRSMVFRRSLQLSPSSDCDSLSLASSTPDEDRTSVALDPLEHEWMMCASDGEWGNLHRLLVAERGLLLKKDFVSGFTCLHWAAKHGKPELIALIVNFAKQHGLPISVDVRSNTGYTPLHVAAMHNHMEVVKLLVGAYDADVEIRDYSGRKACQYLTDNVSVDMRDIIGAYEQATAEDVGIKEKWRFSKVLRSRPLWQLKPSDPAEEVRMREKPLRRRSSLNRMKPALQRLRARTSQIVHSTTFHSPDRPEGSGGSPFRSRPITHIFGLDRP